MNILTLPKKKKKHEQIQKVLNFLSQFFIF